MVTWSPYAFVSMYSVFVNAKHISPFASIVPSMFAKLSLIISTIHYIYANKSIKIKVKTIMNHNRHIVFGTSNDNRLLISRQRNIYLNNTNLNNRYYYNNNERPF